MTEFVKAERRAIPVSIALAGKSGSGKTYSALLLAKGLAGPAGKIAFIDTEKGRGRMYADDPDMPEYSVSELHPPFTPEAYIKKIMAAKDWGADVVVIDSASHEWTGVGGCLEMHEQFTKGKTQLNQLGWANVKPKHRRFVNLIAAPPVNLILCLRAKDGYHEVEDPKRPGKTKLQLMDLPVAEQQKDFVYEMTAMALISDQHQATWTKSSKPLKQVLTPGLITADQGTAIKAWVDGGSAYNQDAEHHLSVMRQIAFDQGLGAFQAYWEDNIRPHPALAKALAAEKDELKSNAQAADDARATAEAIHAQEDEE